MVSAQGAQRLEALADGELPSFFGRLWLDDGEDYHLGRRHVRDPADGPVPLVVDWRAPVAGRFYRATPHRRLDVDRRRRFGFHGRTLVGFEDEVLDEVIEQELGSEFLNAEIERARTGPMRDIIATIQPEQDELKRDDDTSFCIQGAPGTGKTAVGLHRAAWLLYNFPKRLSASGMLVVGPNANFVHYIADVLPTLGETSVWQMTVAELLATDTARGTDTVEAAVLKQDARMATVCERAVWPHVGQGAAGLSVTHVGLVLELDAEVARLTAQSRDRTRSWEAGRKAFEAAVTRALRLQAEELTGRPKDSPWVAALKRQTELKQGVQTAWPRLTAGKVLRWMLREPGFLAEVADGVLSTEEQELLGGTGAVRHSAADLMLLDDLESYLKGGAATSTYSHIVVDEAQDLSPLQCRLIARQCPSGSLTVLGDLAQGTTPWAATHWQEQMAHLGRPEAEHTDLTTGYRLPAAIVELRTGCCRISRSTSRRHARSVPTAPSRSSTPPTCSQRPAEPSKPPSSTTGWSG